MSDFRSFCPNSECFVRTQTERTKPLESGYVSTTRPINQALPGRQESMIKIISLIERLEFNLFHFCRACNKGTYSFVQRDQNTLVKY